MTKHSKSQAAAPAEARQIRPANRSGSSYRHQPRKRFSQNFLRNEQVIDRIVRAIQPREDQHVVEIGPGLGALTLPLLASQTKLTAIELDRDLVRLLDAEFSDLPNFQVIQADALRFNYAQLAAVAAETVSNPDSCSQQPSHRLRIVGNLPYNISTPLIFHLLSFSGLIADMHLMLQKEVVDRLAATPGTRQYGRLTLMTQYYCRVEEVLSVGPEAFHPAPKVWSAVVRMIPHDTLPYPCSNVSLLGDIVAKAFSNRRKTVRNALGGLFAAGQLRDLAIDPQWRPERLALADYVRLANFVDSLPPMNKV